MIPAETVLDCNTEYDWKIHHTGLMTKLENQFNKNVHILIAKQPPTVKEHNSATTQTVPSALRGKMFPAVDHTVDFPFLYEVYVKTWFGLNAAEMVFPIARAFLTIQEETLLEQLKT